MRMLLAAALILCTIGIIFMILDYKPAKRKELISSVPTKYRGFKLLEQPYLKELIENAMKANGKDDSLEKVTKDLIMSAITGVLLLAIMSYFGYPPVGIVLMLGSLTLPFATRFADKKKFKKQYISDFYEFLNYIILHISGGVPVDKALVEVNSLVSEKSLIKKRLQNIIAQRAVSGLVGNTYVDALRDLNRDLDFPEINTFISAAKRTAERGDAIVETLAEQLSDIQKKVDISKRSKITAAESLFNVYQVIFCLLPVMILFVLPMFINGMMQLTFF